MKIALISDAWTPQVNGVVRTLTTTVARARALGHDVTTIIPDLFPTIGCPGYSEIRLAYAPHRTLDAILSETQADIVHIATEGPLGWAGRKWSRRHGVPFTTAFHTRFPDYLAARTKLSPEFFWPLLRRFHDGSRAVLAATPTLAAELKQRRIGPVKLWSRGVDQGLFGQHREVPPLFRTLPRPIMLSVGRVAIEKNLEQFLACPMEGTKIVVGDGPALTSLKHRYPDAHFLGALHGEQLAEAYAGADVFVFPSKTDTFGLVMLEALASGLPVAAYPVAGPLDIIGADGRGAVFRSNRPVGAANPALATAIMEALRCEPSACRALANRYSWDACVDQFLSVLSGAIAEPRLALSA